MGSAEEDMYIDKMSTVEVALKIYIWQTCLQNTRKHPV